jgi:hypothetical protein
MRTRENNFLKNSFKTKKKIYKYSTKFRATTSTTGSNRKKQKARAASENTIQDLCHIGDITKKIFSVIFTVNRSIYITSMTSNKTSALATTVVQ